MYITLSVDIWKKQTNKQKTKQNKTKNKQTKQNTHTHTHAHTLTHKIANVSSQYNAAIVNVPRDIIYSFVYWKRQFEI